MTIGSLTQAFDNIVIDNVLTGFVNHYHVDHANGDDSNDGLTWERAVKTIAQAIALSNATVDWSNKKYNVIWVKPGVYAENLEGDIFFVHIIGLGLRGTDTQAEIHPSTGSVLSKGGEATCNLVGVRLANLWLEVDEGVPILDVEIFNNSLIEGCVFTMGANVAGVVGIDTENCTHLTVRRCDFESGQLQDMAYAIYARGGADKFFHSCRIERNNIFAETCGIYIAALCRATQSLIKQNFVHVATTGYGVRVLDPIVPGNTYVVENDIIVDGLGDAIEHAGGSGYTLRNHILRNLSLIHI